MKNIAKTHYAIQMEVDTLSSTDEQTIRLYKKYRHALMAHTGYAITAVSLQGASQAKLLMNHQLLALIQKIRSIVPVVNTGSTEALNHIKYTVNLAQGEVKTSDFNNVKHGVFFAEADKSVVLDSNLLEDCELTVFLYKSPFTANSQAFNLSQLFDAYGEMNNVVVFDSHHTVFSEVYIADSMVRISVPSPHRVDTAFSNAKEQILSEIHSLSL